MQAQQRFITANTRKDRRCGTDGKCDPPAGPRVSGDCAREPKLPIHPIVCFEVGRFALTQSSWPTLTQRCSRKWMSGPAAYALVLLEDRGQLVTQKLYPSGEHLPPSQGESPLPLDCYLSWMSQIIVPNHLQIIPYQLEHWAGAGIVRSRMDPKTDGWLVVFSQSATSGCHGGLDYKP
jgi:hypothetical protein